MLAALRIRDFRLLWAGGFVSQLGSWLLTVAVPAYVLELTGSLLATGLTLAAEYLPLLLFGPLAGVLADRWDRRRVMLGTDVFRAAAVTSMLFVHSPGTAWVIYLALAAESTGSILFRPAAQALVPAVVGTGPLLGAANSLTALTAGTVRLIGAPLGAVLLLAFNFPVLIGIDVASYLVSALAIAATTRRPTAPRSERATVAQLGRDLRAGLAALAGHPMARWLLVVSTVFLAANASLSAVLIPFGVTELGGARQTGFVISALGVGFLLGAPLIRYLLDRVQPRHLLAGSLLCTGTGFLWLFSVRSVVAALPAAVLVGVFGSMTLVTQQTTLQRLLPNQLLGRVTAVFLTAEAAATLIGAVAGPSMAQAVGITTVAAVACAVTVGSAALALATLPTLVVLVPDPDGVPP